MYPLQVVCFHLVICFHFPPCLSWLQSPFPFSTNIPLSGWAAVYSSPIEGHLGCFQVLALMNKTAIFG